MDILVEDILIKRIVEMSNSIVKLEQEYLTINHQVECLIQERNELLIQLDYFRSTSPIKQEIEGLELEITKTKEDSKLINHYLEELLSRKRRLNNKMRINVPEWEL